jgi:hypothetical protein
MSMQAAAPKANAINKMIMPTAIPLPWPWSKHLIAVTNPLKRQKSMLSHKITYSSFYFLKSMYETK